MRSIFNLLFLLAFWGCIFPKKRLDIFFDKLNASLTKNEREQIKECSDINCLNELLKYQQSVTFLKLLNTLPTDSGLLTEEDLSELTLKDRQLALLVAYNRALNNQDVSLEFITREVILYEKEIDKLYEKKREAEVGNQAKLASENYQKFDVGDTINLLYPLEGRNNYKTVVFYSYYDKFNFKDTLFLKCILVKKDKELISGYKYGHDEFYFYLKIFQLNIKASYNLEKGYSKGDTIRLPLFIYGRVIE